MKLLFLKSVRQTSPDGTPAIAMSVESCDFNDESDPGLALQMLLRLGATELPEDTLTQILEGFTQKLDPREAVKEVIEYVKLERNHRPHPLENFDKAGEFASFEQWVNKARSWIGGRGAICVDAKGRICGIGAHFMWARDENAFPVAYYFPRTNFSDSTVSAGSDVAENAAPCSNDQPSTPAT
jgi:hypothetical protein